MHFHTQTPQMHETHAECKCTRMCTSTQQRSVTLEQQDAAHYN